jgi:hypothetical protein
MILVGNPEVSATRCRRNDDDDDEHNDDDNDMWAYFKERKPCYTSVQFLTSAASACSQVRSCGILLDKVELGPFSPSTSVPPDNSHSTNCSVLINNRTVRTCRPIISILTAFLDNTKGM